MHLTSKCVKTLHSMKHIFPEDNCPKRGCVDSCNGIAQNSNLIVSTTLKVPDHKRRRLMTPNNTSFCKDLLVANDSALCPLSCLDFSNIRESDVSYNSHDLINFVESAYQKYTLLDKAQPTNDVKYRTPDKVDGKNSLILPTNDEIAQMLAFYDRPNYTNIDPINRYLSAFPLKITHKLNKVTSAPRGRPPLNSINNNSAKKLPWDPKAIRMCTPLRSFKFSTINDTPFPLISKNIPNSCEPENATSIVTNINDDELDVQSCERLYKSELELLIERGERVDPKEIDEWSRQAALTRRDLINHANISNILDRLNTNWFGKKCFVYDERRYYMTEASNWKELMKYFDGTLTTELLLAEYPNVSTGEMIYDILELRTLRENEETDDVKFYRKRKRRANRIVQNSADSREHTANLKEYPASELDNKPKVNVSCIDEYHLVVSPGLDGTHSEQTTKATVSDVDPMDVHRDEEYISTKHIDYSLAPSTYFRETHYPALVTRLYDLYTSGEVPNMCKGVTSVLCKRSCVDIKELDTQRVAQYESAVLLNDPDLINMGQNVNREILKRSFINNILLHFPHLDLNLLRD